MAPTLPAPTTVIFVTMWLSFRLSTKRTGGKGVRSTLETCATGLAYRRTRLSRINSRDVRYGFGVPAHQTVPHTSAMAPTGKTMPTTDPVLRVAESGPA